MAPYKIGRRLAAIVSVDVVGFCWLMGAVEEGTLARRKAHWAATDPLVEKLGGCIVSTAGDGLLFEFLSTVEVVNCAIDVQKLMAEQQFLETLKESGEFLTITFPKTPSNHPRILLLGPSGAIEPLITFKSQFRSLPSGPAVTTLGRSLSEARLILGKTRDLMLMAKQMIRIMSIGDNFYHDQNTFIKCAVRKSVNYGWLDYRQ